MSPGLLDETLKELGPFVGQEGGELVFTRGYLRLNRSMADDEPARKLPYWSTGWYAAHPLGEEAMNAEVGRLELTWEIGHRGFSLAARQGQQQQRVEEVEPVLARLTKMTSLLRLGTRALVWLAPGTPALVEEVAATAGRRRKDAGALHPGAAVGAGQRRGAAAVGRWIKSLMEVRNGEEEGDGLQPLRGRAHQGRGGQEEGQQGGAAVLERANERRQPKAGLERLGHQGRGHASRSRARGQRPTPLEPLGGPGGTKRG